MKINVEQFQTVWLLAHHRQVAEITTHRGQVTKLTGPSRPGHLALGPHNCVLIAVKKSGTKVVKSTFFKIYLQISTRATRTTAHLCLVGKYGHMQCSCPMDMTLNDDNLICGGN